MVFYIGRCTIHNVVLLLCAILARTDEHDNIIQSMKQAVFDIYDENRTLMHNYFSILALLCPESVFCSGNNVSVTIEERYNSFWSYENSTEGTYRTNEKKRQARQYLKENKDQLSGCCEPCSCEFLCIEKQNCCPEYQFRRKNITSQSAQRQECFFASVKSYTPKFHSRIDELGKTYFTVTDCYTGHTNESTRYRCQNPNTDIIEDIVPVYSNISTRIYKNKYCAECNNDPDVMPWTLEVNINERLTITNELLTSPEQLQKIIVNPRFYKYFDAYFNPPIGIDFKENSCYTRSGNEYSCTQPGNNVTEYDADFINFRLCSFKTSLYHTLRGLFKNIFCHLCVNFGKLDKSPMKCEYSSRSIIGSFAAILLPFSFVETVKDISTKGPCNCKEYFNPKLKECRELRCPPGTYFAPCDCLNFIDITSLPIHVYLEILPTRHIAELYQPEIGKDWLDSLLMAINETLKDSFAPAELKTTLMFREMSKANKSYVKLYTSVYSRFKGSLAKRTHIQRTFNLLHKGLSINVRDHQLILRLSVPYTLDPTSDYPFPVHERFENSDTIMDNVLTSYERELIQIEATYIQPLNKLIYCTRVVLSQDELDSLKNDTRFQQLIEGLQYFFYEKDPSLCLEDYIDMMVESCFSLLCGGNVIIFLMCKVSLSFTALITLTSFD